jgi:Amidohydrolase
MEMFYGILIYFSKSIIFISAMKIKITFMEKPPIINCHSHIFTGKNVPPYLAKTFLVWPLYLIITPNFIINIFRFWYKNRKYSPYFFKHKRWFKFLTKLSTHYSTFVKGNLILYFIVGLANLWLISHALLFLFKKNILKQIYEFLKGDLCIVEIKQFLVRYHILRLDLPLYLNIIILLFVIIFVKSGRDLILFLAKSGLKFMRLLPSKATIEFIGRYFNIGRFAIYERSLDIFGRLNSQYDEQTGFVVLPMDLSFMAAGTLDEEGNFQSQMGDLISIKRNNKNIFFPFVFVDPRRIAAQSNFLNIEGNPETGEVTLLECDIKRYIENEKFNGFKIYPALGYYPFDERLLLLWKYAADRNFPIMTHAIRGTIFYRGTKKKEWNFHPIFKQSTGKGDKTFEPLLLPETQNIDFINNFTHPLNYLCLVDERMLRRVVAQSTKPIKDFFGYIDDDTKLKHDLAQLKICFGHYGGDDEWEKFFETDRNNYAASIITNKDIGIDFLRNSQGKFTEGKIEELWRDIDWYSIITSLMLQYDNLYADISYILHNEKIYPLLKQTLNHEKLKHKILFGTDFYVVRNHKTEKQMLAELKANLSTEDFDLIARYNPIKYLNSVNFE